MVEIRWQGPERVLPSGGDGCWDSRPALAMQLPSLAPGKLLCEKMLREVTACPLCLETPFKLRPLPSVFILSSLPMSGHMPPWLQPWPANPPSSQTGLISVDLSVTGLWLILFTVSRPDPVTHLLTQLPGLTLDLPHGSELVWGLGFLAEPCYCHWTCPARLVGCCEPLLFVSALACLTVMFSFQFPLLSSLLLLLPDISHNDFFQS